LENRQPPLAAISGITGLLFGHIHAPSQERLAHIPWWAWVGGIMGAVYIMSMLLVAERLGAAFWDSPSPPPSSRR